MTRGATCQEYRPDTRSGRVVLDDGRSLPFAADVFAASGLRLLRPGQRLERFAVFKLVNNTAFYTNTNGIRIDF